MVSATTFIESFLAHYASEYYDPQKAHDYYMRTRQLKGLDPNGPPPPKTSKGRAGPSQAQKEALLYTKAQIDDAQKKQTDALTQYRQQLVQKAEELASSKRDAVGKQIQELIQALTDSSKQTADQVKTQHAVNTYLAALNKDKESKRISAEAKSKIDALPPIPAGLTKDQHANLTAERAKKIADINQDTKTKLNEVADAAKTATQSSANDAAAKLKDLSTQTGEAKAKETANAEVGRKMIADELSASVEKARTAYEQVKQQIQDQFDQTRTKEFAAIQKQV